MTTTAKVETVRRVASTRLPTPWGEFQLLGYERVIQNCTRHVETALVMVMGELNEETPLLRIHSQCVTSEVFGSLRCDCQEQLEIAMRAIAREGRGLVIYEHQEGRGIGLMAKLQAYALQDEGLDTVEANHALGFAADCRDFSLPVAILHDLEVFRVRHLSNNPAKLHALLRAGIDVVEQIPCEAATSEYSMAYLQAKKEKMGHALSLSYLPRLAFAEPPTARRIKARHTSEEDDNVTFVQRPQSNGLIYHFDSRYTLELARSPFARIEDALREMRAGRMVVVVDDEDRENEGDLTMAADMITPEAINFMATHGRGLICLAMTDEQLDHIGLDPMVSDNTALHDTAFTVSIDAKGQDVTTGISAHDRAYTISAAIDENSSPEDFARPGHIFPLRARDGGVLERRGQTEAAVDLARLAGLTPAGVICEIINDDGTMARVPDLIRFCEKHSLLMITVADLAQYRLELRDRRSPAAIDPSAIVAA